MTTAKTPRLRFGTSGIPRSSATPGTVRTRLISVSRSGLTSLICSTFGSTTQIDALMFRMWLVVQDMMPKNTEHCCDISSAANVSPLTSMIYLALSPSSIRNAI